MELTPQEKTLLLYVEAAAVEHSGLLNTEGISTDEWIIVKRWHNTHFVRFGDASHHHTPELQEDNKTATPTTLWCELSKKAWKMAKETRNTMKTETS